MDVLHTLVELGLLGGMAAGAWICFVNAGKYDADSLASDQSATREARARAHVTLELAPFGHGADAYPPLDRAA